jgi:hypothetical protein
MAPTNPLTGRDVAGRALWLVTKPNSPPPYSISKPSWACARGALLLQLAAFNRVAQPLVHRLDMLDQSLMLLAQALELVGEV